MLKIQKSPSVSAGAKNSRVLPSSQSALLMEEPLGSTFCLMHETSSEKKSDSLRLRHIYNMHTAAKKGPRLVCEAGRRSLQIEQRLSAEFFSKE